MQLSPSIFKAYDIRGIVPSTLDEEVAQAMGRAFGAAALREGEKAVAVGRDGRLSGPALSAALVRGLVASGIDVIDVGMVTTPMLYFAASTLCTSGIQVTGSHNPKDYNGFKMVLAGRAIYGEEIQALRRAMEGPQPDAPAPGKVRNVNVFGPYRDRIVSDVRLARPMKIVVDSGNGVAGASAPAILRALGCEVVELYSEVDGNFPNHHPDPSKPENLKDLIAALRTSGAELGLAFDGDGDRLGIITRGGNNIYPDRQMMLFARDVLTRVPGGTILFDVKCTQRLAPAIREAGGQPLMYKTGHSLIKARMKEVDSPLGGEMSGHIFFKERWFGFDDGTYAGARLLEILSRSQDPSAVLDQLPTSHSTPELNVKCQEGEPHALVAQLTQKAKFAAPAEVSTIDGVRVDWPDGFGLIRASNTTPVLVLRFEGHTPEALHRIEAEMLALLRSVKPDASFAEAAH
ncbi:phosphomannomutase/phosphoglucomutase [Ramlibacter tataouinensis]|uniref:Phosphomannomutase/phosphoglucomutase-like protein n=1 Tax=Ramlibacter tataouinensis (strain ATCC BAA-407 / DSM 14655 / LMG 21543 / TTB310) TaxID=365046 RepID=F5Y0W3_RAMTT|nr:phosphomannomutase/phosphoglucomutase [Ramlibacter tataouinensis]AEG92181.1 phosphomannomutase/phosphoglucomutase-like protein [Ramlibacter tataouinensis TTB310]